MKETKVFEQGKSKWYQIRKNDLPTIASLRADGLDPEILAYAIDEDENAHVEYDAESGTLLLVFNVPKKDDTLYEASPIAFIVTKDAVYSFTTDYTDYINDYISGLLSNEPKLSKLSLVFKTLYLCVHAYFPIIKDVNKKRAYLTTKLKSKATKHNLLELSDLGIGLVYIVTAIDQNDLLLNQLSKLGFYKDLTESEKERLEDAQIEADQVVAMARVADQILDEVAATYNNLLNNNLNETMRLLTIWSLLLTVPTIVTGFFGMNVLLPFKDSPFGWIFILLISLILSLGLLFTILRRIK